MYTPIHLLPQYDKREAIKYQNRWTTNLGEKIKGKIIDILLKGASLEILQKEFDAGKLKGLENGWDLKGINIQDLELNLPDSRDSFKRVDFSYASIGHSVFKDCVFYSPSFVFTRLFDCKFINCTFLSNSFYASTFEDVDFLGCDFIDDNRLRNCDLRDVKFQNCYIPINIFLDCQFEERTRVEDLKSKPNNWPDGHINPKDLAEIYKGIKEGYVAGDVLNRSREYYFKQRQSVTRHNIEDFPQKFGNLLLEYVAGYGVKPFRVLNTMIMAFLIFTVIFILKIGFKDGLLLSVGAFFTNGANSQFLNTFDLFYSTLYMFESFLGITLMTAFITVLANLWFREK